MKLKPFMPLIGACALLAVAGAAYDVEYSFIGAKSTQAADLAKSIADKSNASQRVTLARTTLAGLKTQEAAVTQYFISTNDVVPFLEQLSATGKYLGSTVTVASVSAVPGTPYGQVQLSVQITGPFDAVLRTIGAIEYGPYATTVTNLSLTTASSQGSASSSAPWSATAMFSIGAQNSSASPLTAPSPAASMASSSPAQSNLQTNESATSTSSSTRSASPVKPTAS